MQPSVLIVDDDAQIREMLEKGLQKENYVTLSAETGEAGIKAARRKLPSVIVLDINLPKMSGIEVCQAIKREEATASIPILMITGNDNEGQEIISLELGADDYLPKPFDIKLLSVHLRALLRRGPYLGTKPEILEKPDIKLDINNKRVFLKGRGYANLTPKEFDLLLYLVQCEPKVIPRELIYRKVWGIPPPSESVLRTVDVHVQRLRVKLNLDRKIGIVAVSGRGYVWGDVDLSPGS